LFCEISNQSQTEIEIRIIKQFSPFSIGLDGVLQSTIELIRMTKKWRIEHEKKMAELIEKQAVVEIQLKAEDVETKKLENERLSLEVEKLRRELSPSLEAVVVHLLPPDTSADDQHAQLACLIPHLLTIASSRLAVKNIEVREESHLPLGKPVFKQHKALPEKAAGQASSSKEEELYRTLLAMVGNDHPRVERLVKHEYGFTPNASREELLNNAIQKLLRDRHIP
jgi:hypothetical protein